MNERNLRAGSTWRIPLADVDIGAAEEEVVLDVMRRGWLTMGSVTAAFEDDFARLTGARHALAVTNCTAALHLAGVVLGWKPGDEVIVPSLTFVATANAVRYTGATPVFADIVGENDFSLCAQDVARRITPRTRAIVVVHYAGYPVDMPAMMALAAEYELDVVEDAAHAPGASLNDRPLGTWGRIGCFSFFSNKNMTAGEGGMIITDDDDLAERLRLLRSHGMTSLTWDRHRGHAWSYDVVAPGYNYRIDEIRSAIGRVQLSKLATNNDRRRMLDEAYRERLNEHAPMVGVPYQSHPGLSAYHLRPILLPSTIERTAFMDHLKSHGIQTSIHYPPVHQFSSYRSSKSVFNLPVTEAVARRQVTLPLYPGMSIVDVETVVEAVSSAILKYQKVSDRSLVGMTDGNA